MSGRFAVLPEIHEELAVIRAEFHGVAGQDLGHVCVQVMARSLNPECDPSPVSEGGNTVIAADIEAGKFEVLFGRSLLDRRRHTDRGLIETLRYGVVLRDLAGESIADI